MQSKTLLLIAIRFNNITSCNFPSVVSWKDGKVMFN